MFPIRMQVCGQSRIWLEQRAFVRESTRSPSFVATGRRSSSTATFPEVSADLSCFAARPVRTSGLCPLNTAERTASLPDPPGRGEDDILEAIGAGVASSNASPRPLCPVVMKRRIEVSEPKSPCGHPVHDHQDLRAALVVTPRPGLPDELRSSSRPLTCSNRLLRCSLAGSTKQNDSPSV